MPSIGGGSQVVRAEAQEAERAELQGEPQLARGDVELRRHEGDDPARYGRRSQTRTEHLRQIRRYLRFRKATANDLTIFPHGLTAFPSRGPFRFPFRATKKTIKV